jgi:hypothetical protein
MGIPAFGLGTFRLQGQTVIDSAHALELGYRAIDTAQIYGNEAEVGQAIAEAGVPRELFLTTKVWIDSLARDAVVPSLEEPARCARPCRPGPDPLAVARRPGAAEGHLAACWRPVNAGWCGRSACPTSPWR